MGACASVIGMGKNAEAGEAPAPEPAKEELVQSPKTTEEVEVEQVEKNADGVDDENKQQSLGSLLNETEAKKESTEDEKPKEEAPVAPKEEAPKTEGVAEPEKKEEAKKSVEKTTAGEESK